MCCSLVICVMFFGAKVVPRTAGNCELICPVSISKGIHMTMTVHSGTVSRLFLREHGFESCSATMFVYEEFLLVNCCLAECFREQSRCYSIFVFKEYTLIAAWLNASQSSRGGVRMNSSAR